MHTFDKKPSNDEKVTKPASKKQVTSTPNRHQQVLQMQRDYGNKAVRGMIQRDDFEIPGFGEIPGIGTSTPSGGTSIGDGTATITAENGLVTIDAAAVNINAAMTTHAGVDESDTVVTDSVIASNYTPGAGNMF